jgi:hypothetical protein
VANDVRGLPQHKRRGERLSNGAVVVTEYDASGQLLRSTYYYSTNEGLLAKIIKGGSDESPPRMAD